MKPIHYLVAFITLHHIGMAATRVAVPLYAIYLQAPPAVVGVLVALFAAIPTVASVHIGRLVDRVGTRTPLVVFSLLIVAGILLPYIFPGAMIPLYVCGLTVGGAYFALFIVNTALGGSYGGSKERAGNFALASLAYSAANGLGPLIAGFAIDHAGFRLTFLLLAITPVVGLGVFLLGKLPQRAPAVQQAAPSAGSKRSIMDLWRSKQLRPIFIISIYFMLFWDVFQVMTPIYGSQLRLSASVIGIIIGTFSAAGFVVRIFIPPLARRFTPMQLLLISQTLGGLILLAFGLSTTAGLLIVCAFLLGMGQGLGGPMITTAVYEASPSDRVGEAMGLRMSVGMACQAILPLFAGVAASALGVAPLFWIAALVLIFGAWQYRAQWHVDLRADNTLDNARKENT